MPVSEAIPVADLQLVRAALNAAYHQNTVLDLAEQYRKLTQRSSQSKLTMALEHALLLVEDYIDALTDQEPDEHQPSDQPE